MANEIQEKLFSMQETSYQSFAASLIPNIAPARIIGVRVPLLRGLAKSLDTTEKALFLSHLPHTYLEEDYLHAFLIASGKDFDATLAEVERFLPYLDNWATCDSLRPAVFSKNKEKLLLHIEKWLASNHPYTVRFAIEMLMVHFLDADFDKSHLARVAAVQSDEYYVNMMVAWYFATALAKQYESTLPYLENARLSPWIHAKTIQKAIESYRVSAEHKQILRSLRKK